MSLKQFPGSWISIVLLSITTNLVMAQPWFMDPNPDPRGIYRPGAGPFPGIPSVAASNGAMCSAMMTQCLQDVPLIENLCSSFHAIVLGMWNCVQMRKPHPQPELRNADRDTFVWKEDDNFTGQCWRLQSDYPEMKAILRCHNDYYRGMSAVYRESCLLETTFFECMGWPIADQMDCNRNDGGFGGSSLILDVQLPQKKSLTSSQNICIRSKNQREKDCQQEVTARCGGIIGGGGSQFWSMPTTAETKLEHCFRQKSMREAEALRRSEEMLEGLQGALNHCVEEHETRLWTRLQGQILGTPKNRTSFESRFSNIFNNFPPKLQWAPTELFSPFGSGFKSFNILNFLRSAEAKDKAKKQK